MANHIERAAVVHESIWRPTTIHDSIQRDAVAWSAIRADDAKVMFDDAVVVMTNRRLLENGNYLISEDSKYRILE